MKTPDKMNVKLGILSTLLCAILTFAMGCSQQQHDERLTHVSGVVSNDPESALHLLDSIDSEKLSESDRHYYDFLTIKAKDKNYVQHESDSLILDVLDYYSGDENDPLYVESLYYAGRVYSDIGDYPTALQYYQKASDQLKATTGKDDLKVRIDNQTGMLLERLRLYDQAVTYYTNVLNQKIVEGDSIGIVYTLQRLGRISFDSALQNVADSISSYQYLNEADSLLSLSLDYAVTLPESFSAISRVFLSGVKQEKGDLKHALKLIKCSLDLVEPDFKNVALAYATDIYIDAGIVDTAYMYANELISNDNMLNKKSGYRFLLSTELRKYVHPDSLNQYYDKYSEILEEYFDENRNAQTLLQETQYNYQLHERESLKAHKANERLQWAIAGFVFLVLILAIVILYLKYRNKANIVRLQEALDTLDILKRNIIMSETFNNNTEISDNKDVSDEAYNDESCNNTSDSNIPNSNSTDYIESEASGHNGDSVNPDNQGDSKKIPEYIKPNKVKDLRKLLLQELIALSEQGERQGISMVILESKIYSKIQSLLAVQKPMKQDMWEELEKTVICASPRFNTNLRILTRNKVTEQEHQTALLVKCGFKPVEMRSLLALTNGAINSRRATLGAKILDEKRSVTFVDNIIRLL